MTARELAEKLLHLEDPDIPVVLVLEQWGNMVSYADPYGIIVEVDIHTKTENCALAVGDGQIVLQLIPASKVPRKP